MKKIILTALAVLSTFVSYAQHAPGTVTVQPKVALNVATLTNSEGADPRIALAAGAELEYQMTDMVSLSGGLLYSMQGVKGTEGGLNGTVKLDYINIPILANVYVVKGLAVKVGLQPGFMINNKIKISQGSTSAEVSLEDALANAGLDDAVKKFDLSIPMGVSYEFNNLVLEARYNFGLTEVIADSKAKNSVFQLSLGYKFGL
ncbi:MAG: PorT family protein [Prevotella sp.]|nr:PorT family protein [Prevotella sp.]